MERFCSQHIYKCKLNLTFDIPSQNFAQDAEHTLVRKESDVAFAERLGNTDIQSLPLPEINLEFTYRIQSHTTLLPLLRVSPFHPNYPLGYDTAPPFF